MSPADFGQFFGEAHEALSENARRRLTAKFGDSTIAIYCSCDALWSRLEPAIAHWQESDEPGNEPADFNIFAGTNEGLREPLKAPAWRDAQFTEAGVPLQPNGQAAVDFDLRFQPWQKVIHAHQGAVGLFWCESAEVLPWWEATFPFRILLHWWSQGKPFQLMHAAAVSADGQTAWLIPGPSGSGKSTTVVSLLQAGFPSQGDDYVLVSTDESPRVYPLYNSIKLTWEAVDQFFPHLRPTLRLPAPDAKAVAALTDLGRLACDMPIRGVLVPALPSKGRRMPFEPINPGEALLAIAPTTLHHLPEGRAESWTKMSAFLRRLPVMKWHLAPDLKTNVQRFPFAAVQQVQRVAVIMPAFNPGPEIERAWRAIRGQDWVRAVPRIFLIDDASTDEASVSRMQTLAAAYPQHIQYIRLPKNAGPAAARNAGIAKALAMQVDWVAFCDHDDEWPADKWTRQAGHALQHPALQIVGGLVKYHVAEGLEDPIDKYLDDDKHVSHVHLGALLARPAVFQQVGTFDESLRFSEDFDWWNRVREANISYQILSATALHYHFHGDNSVRGKDFASLGVLDILHRSLQRRRAASAGSAPRPIPSLRDAERAVAYDVVVPVHNGLPFLPDLLASIASQTAPAASVHFVNDASTDGSGAWLDEHVPAVLGARGVIHHLKENLGVAGARNVGWRAGTSPWVALLDQDDRWLPLKMERQLAHLMARQNTHWGTVHCRPVLDDGFRWPSNWAPSMKVPHKCDVPSGWVISRAALYQLGGFNDGYRYGDDTEIAGRLRDLFGIESLLDEVLVERRFGPHNNSHKKEEMTAELMQILRGRIQQKKERKTTSRKQTYIVVSVYNAERYLDETLNAIEAQTHRDWIGCIVNDGSADNSLEIAARHAKRDLRWRVIDQPNQGAPAAVNAALKRMPSEVAAVAFCDSDDLWLPEKLERQWAAATGASDEIWCIGSLVEEFEDYPEGVQPKHRARPGAHRAILRSNALMSRALVDQLGAMDPDKRFGDFIEWMAPQVRKGLETQYVEEVLTRRRIHGENMTAKADEAAYLALLQRHLKAKRDQP
ncbi:glycosyltransferase [bacterium]|nr:glycosyltransferase [bacterium]